MKLYTDEIQTAKLIELGFEKPRALVDKYYDYDAEDYAEVKAYSVGELIEMLGYDLYSMHYLGMSWEVKGEQVAVINEELIDALYDMCIKLKAEGVI